ncbi:MAG TPA: ABC transporter permease [Candidatus Polarisedimenticolaceae bacterium]|nr:ABC transporter permease [Candidatus Polarisedimenticolaceae bacterium]
MNKILHVAVREFLATVATKGFVFGLVILPLVVLVAVFGIGLLIDEEAPRVEGDVAIFDPTGEVAEGLAAYLRPQAIAERREDFQELIDERLPSMPGAGTADARGVAMRTLLGEVPALEVVPLEAGADLEQAKRSLHEGPAEGGRLALVVVDDDAVVKPADSDRFGRYQLFVREKLDDRVVDEINDGLREAIVDARVGRAGLDRAYIDSLTRVGRVRSKTVTAEGEKETNELLNAMMPAAFMLLLFASVMTGGQSLMTTTVEEKSSRVVEVLLSAVSPMQLMTGKVIGQMLVGFLVLAVYGGMGVASLAFFALAGMVDLSLLFYLVIFYLIAYFVVASLMAAIGAAVNEMREAQSLLGPVMLIVMIPWILWMPISRNPDSTFAVVTSFVPPLNPFVMLIRMTSTSPPPSWQVWLSIAVGVGSVYGAVWLAAKVFRVGLLMYGKPPNFATLIRWVRMA